MALQHLVFNNKKALTNLAFNEKKALNHLVYSKKRALTNETPNVFTRIRSHYIQCLNKKKYPLPRQRQKHEILPKHGCSIDGWQISYLCCQVLYLIYFSIRLNIAITSYSNSQIFVVWIHIESNNNSQFMNPYQLNLS